MGYFIIFFGIFCVGFLFALKNYQTHFLLFFSLILYFIYLFLGPLNSYNFDSFYKFGAYFGDYFYTGIAVYILAISTFIGVYIISFKNIRNKNIKNTYKFSLKNKVNFYIFLLFSVITYVIINKNDTSQIEYTGVFWNYLILLSDSLLLAFIILIYERKMKIWIWGLLAVSMVYFLILGFRYRIILLLIGIIYNFVINHNIGLKSVIRWLALIVFVFFTINFISINRSAFRNFEFSEIQFTTETPNSLTPYQFFMHQTSNYATDFVLFKYMDKANISHDLGYSMFGHIFIRIVPSSFFVSGVKPSIPQQETIRKSFGTNEGYYAGAALTNIFSYYFAFGYYGVIFFMGLLGYILAYMSSRFTVSSPRDRILIIIAAMVLFQEITRGYLPQNITLLIFLLLTYKLFYKKKYVRYSH